MSELVVITFPTETGGPDAFDALRDAQKTSGLALKDLAVAIRNPGGSIMVLGDGGQCGLLLAVVFFPTGGQWLGLDVGDDIIEGLQQGVGGQMVKDVTKDLPPGSSAVVALVDTDPAALARVAVQFHGRSYQISLDEGTESQLEGALRDLG